MPDTDYILIGRIVKPHGIRGEVCIDYYADSPFLLDEAGTLYLAPPSGGTPRSVRVRKWRRHHERILLLLEGTGDRNAAEALRGTEVFVRAEVLPELDDDEVYAHEVIGCRILLEDGGELGRLEDIQFIRDQEIWSIVTAEKREVLFPAQEEFITDVDLDAGVITIAPPPGLIDIYLAD